jgi:hypothetical protein
MPPPARTLTMEELLALPPSVIVKDAAAALNIGQALAYEYAAAGEIPGEPPIRVHRYGHGYRVNRADIFRRLGLDPALAGTARAPEADARAGAA